jgi:alkylhydroperoxidase/carboxymuconolactone decarboxylase family protein
VVSDPRQLSTAGEIARRGWRPTFPFLGVVVYNRSHVQQERKEEEVHYYESEDLKRFAEVGKFRKELMDQFFAYYNEVTAKDGALTRREKALIALAVAHSRQCPYCIDAYTTQCLESGAGPEQMTEAIHVAAAMEAGMTLVHGVQMHNALERCGG